MSESNNLFLARLKSRGANPVVVAHRGDSFHAPENTLEAARLAHDSGADAWELDVHFTRDGVPVVLHDESLVRTTDVAARFQNDPRGRSGFRVADFDFDEVRALDAGSWFVDEVGGDRSAHSFGSHAKLSASSIAHYRSGRVTIPTLAEALRLTIEYNWLVNVEIKSFPDGPDGRVERVLAVIAETGAARRALISSFDHTDVAAANRSGREYGLGILVATPLSHMAEYTANLAGADTVHVSAEVLGSESIAYRRRPGARALRADLISELKEREIPILVYTVNDHGSDGLADHLAALSVDGLFTDDPAGVKRSLEAKLVTAQRGGPR